jgi:hypothetical protein
MNNLEEFSTFSSDPEKVEKFKQDMVSCYENSGDYKNMYELYEDLLSEETIGDLIEFLDPDIS